MLRHRKPRPARLGIEVSVLLPALLLSLLVWVALPRSGSAGDEAVPAAMATRLQISPAIPVVRLRQDQPGQSGAFAAVDACVAQEMRDQGTPGVSLAIAVGGRQVYTATYGVKEAGGHDPVNPRTLFRINSTTKMMTAAAVLLAAEAGELSLDAPITAALPDLALLPPWEASDITLRDLLSQTGGLPDTWSDLGADPSGYTWPPDDTSLLGWTTQLRYQHLFAPPGSFWNYTSAGFALAGAALEAAAGRPYGTLVAEGLWRPAGMARTTMDPADVLADGDYAIGHLSGVKLAPDDYAQAWRAPGGGAFSTPSEMLRWALLLARGGDGVLSAAAVAAMTAPQVVVENVPIAQRAAYGYGVFVEDFRPVTAPAERVRVLYHPGNGRGQSSELWWVPETGFAISILANTVSGMDRSALCALREIEGLERVPVAEPAPGARVLDRYAGTWSIVDTVGRSWTARVWRVGGSLHLTYTDWSAAPAIAAAVPEVTLRYRHDAAFHYDGYGGNDVQFVDGQAGRTHALWMQALAQVGRRAGEMPASIEIEGTGCASLPLVPDSGPDGADLPGSALRAYGPSPQVSLRAQAITQDDPARPESSTVRLDVPASGAVGLMIAYVSAEADDVLDLYLMRDIDGDQAFTWPEEMVDRALGPNTQILLARTPLPAGRYQLWVHGRRVNGAGSRFDLDLAVAAGDGLRLEGVPATLVAGRQANVQVCADRPIAETFGLGIVTLDLGDGVRVARVPVRWQPGQPAPTVALWLPWLRRGR